jgi:predicted dehydrogenase
MSRHDKPRIGALGLGWIGRHRLEAVADSELADIVVLADPEPEAREEAAWIAPEADLCEGMESLLDYELDGVMVATPSAYHAWQSEVLLLSGNAVFCQKPLGRTGRETRRVIETARKADRLLACDFSYRYVDGVPQMRELVTEGRLGGIFSAELVFHNAYGPEKEWFYRRDKSGGGCVMDLGIHLVDMALWMLGYPEVTRLESYCYTDGEPIETFDDEIEDYAEVMLQTDDGTSVRLACSWHLDAGRDCVIGARFYGDRGGVCLRNVDGSFYDFVAEHFEGTSSDRLAEPPDEWGGRAAVEWVARLRRSAGYDPQIESAIPVADILDGIYGRKPGEQSDHPARTPGAGERAGIR